MTAEIMMKEYSAMKKELSVLEFQISHFTGVEENDVILSMLYGHHDDTERVQTGTVSDRTASIAINYRKVMDKENDEWFNFLWERYRYVKEEVDFFEAGIRCLPQELSGIMQDMISGDLSWDELSDKYHISRASVGNYRKNAIKQLNEAYRLRDMMQEAFMLS